MLEDVLSRRAIAEGVVLAAGAPLRNCGADGGTRSARRGRGAGLPDLRPAPWPRPAADARKTGTAERPAGWGSRPSCPPRSRQSRADTARSRASAAAGGRQSRPRRGVERWAQGGRTGWAELERWARGGRHAAGQRPGCGSVAGLAAPTPSRASRCPGSGGSSLGRSVRAPSSPAPARPWHVTRACALAPYAARAFAVPTRGR